MINGAYMMKSFYCLRKPLEKCFDCTYCRAFNDKNNIPNYTIIPTEINPNFKNIPRV